MKNQKIFSSETVYTLCFLLIFSSCNKLGPNSDKLIGRWLSLSEWESQGGYTGITTERTITLEKSGDGILSDKVISKTRGRRDYSYKVKYLINWVTRKKDGEDILIVKFRKAGILMDSSKNEESLTKIINKHIVKSDTTFFAVESDGSLICHLPNETKKFKINLL